ncbi:CDP-glycerol glycerophosphotransferase family protein [Butyrivibrio sp. AE2015]|uniref:CDP-glycerol glycerophosphotransferase family protein n=1 Tax=Butyrivibrio sp. AE2015 TaxID=1280663 RepID=UPI0003B53F57|nr:CDP-glycerol glycerophosphotransferase family protein [Butyrivibrio sp. AE2015]
MYKNVVIKKALKESVFKIASLVNCVIPKDDRIILLYSSNKGIWSNLKSIKDYLLENRYDEKYRIICGIESYEYAEKDTNRVTYYTKLKSFLIFLRSRHVFYTSGQIPIKPSPMQIVIHLDHGSANFKKCGAMTNINNGDEFFFTYYLAPSKVYIPIVMKEYLCKENNVKICGEACTDVMFGNYEKYDLGNYSAIILWTPTFRQSDYYGYDDSEEELLPMFDEKKYEELNDKLKLYKFKLIVKLHPGQDLSKYNKLMYSNLEIYSDVEFRNRGYDLYSMMPQMDYMLADYSSTFLQFLLLDKPMAFVVPDLEEYSEKRGFVFESYRDYMPGEFITTREELYDVFEAWSHGADNHKEERRRVKNLIHRYQDGNNAKRALEISKISL